MLWTPYHLPNEDESLSRYILQTFDNCWPNSSSFCWRGVLFSVWVSKCFCIRPDTCREMGENTDRSDIRLINQNNPCCHIARLYVEFPNPMIGNLGKDKWNGRYLECSVWVLIGQGLWSRQFTTTSKCYSNSLWDISSLRLRWDKCWTFQQHEQIFYFLKPKIMGTAGTADSNFTMAVLVSTCNAWMCF